MAGIVWNDKENFGKTGEMRSKRVHGGGNVALPGEIAFAKLRAVARGYLSRGGGHVEVCVTG
jgi:hypothetical protein